MSVFVFLVAFGVTAPVSATGAGFCNSHPASPHCHIGHHGDTARFDWDLIVNIFDVDGIELLDLVGIYQVSHADVITVDPEVLCDEAADFAGIDVDFGYASSELFIDVHLGLSHTHEGHAMLDGANHLTELDHYHILTATCTLAGSGNNGGGNNGKGNGKNK